MRLNGRIAALLVLLAVGAAACAGNPAPEPPPVVAETVPAPDADSLAAVRAAEREAAAARLCREAASAMAAGNYDRARSLYTQAQRDYAGTECADTAGGQIALIDAIMVIRERVHFDFDKYNIRDDAAAVERRPGSGRPGIEPRHRRRCRAAGGRCRTWTGSGSRFKRIRSSSRYQEWNWNRLLTLNLSQLLIRNSNRSQARRGEP